MLTNFFPLLFSVKDFSASSAGFSDFGNRRMPQMAFVHSPVKSTLDHRDRIVGTSANIAFLVSPFSNVLFAELADFKLFADRFDEALEVSTMVIVRTLGPIFHTPVEVDLCELVTGGDL